MKFRKKIAAILAAAMVMTLFPTTVFASGTVLTTTSQNSVSGNVSGNVNYVDTHKLVVTMPTTANLDFALDPQGLSTISSGSTVSEGALIGDMGKIVSTEQTYVKNESSVPIKLSAKFYLTDGNNAAPSDIDIVSKNNLVSDNKLSLYMEILSGVNEGVSANNYVSTNVVAAGTGAPITGTSVATASEVIYQLESADYAFQNTGVSYNYVIDSTVSDNYDCAYFTLSGNVAKDANWGPYTGTNATKTLKLNAVFTFTELENYVAGANSSAAHGLVATASLLDELGTTPVVVTNPNLTATRTVASTANTVSTFASTVSSVKYTKFNTTVKDVALTTSMATVSGTQVTILGSWAKTFGAGTYEFTATLSNGSTQKLIITIS